MLRVTFVLIALCLFFSTSAFGKTLYVDANHGSDSVSYAANSASSPWRTIGRAAWGSTNRGAPVANEAARAGDLVIVRAGTYTVTGTGSRTTPAYNPVNSGTSSAPIVFQAEGVVVLTQSGTGPVIGAYGSDYIVWKGFTINEIDALAQPDTGPVVLWGTVGSRIEDCIIDGFDDGRMGDNHNGIRIEYTTDVVIRNNRIFNVLNYGRVHHNGAGIMAYYSRGALIEHNEIYDSGSGIFVKGGDNRDFTIRKNLLRNNGDGIVVMYTHPEGLHRIYQNVVANNRSAMSVALHSMNVLIANNTFVENNNGLRIGWCGDTLSNIRFFNNIVANNSDEGISGGECSTSAPLTLDHNLYFNNPRGWSINGTRYTSLSAWRGALGGGESNSTVGDPGFQGAAVQNFALTPDSPALRGGVDILDLTGNGNTSEDIPRGAFVSGCEIIGPTTGVDPDACPPMAPTAVTVN